MKTFTSWQPPLVWRGAMALAALVTRLLSRLEVTGDGLAGTKDGLEATSANDYDNSHGLIVAVNHISPFDPIALTAACRARGIAPRFLAQEQLFTGRFTGPLMRRAGHIRVDRDKPTATRAVTDAHAALEEGSAILIYPEGRISLDPGLWPERGKTGTGRLALTTGAQLIPAAIWGSHEVLPYSAPKGMWPVIWRSLRHRPKVRVHFGAPLDLSDIDTARPGAAQKVTDRLMDAIVDELAPLRQDEPQKPRLVDPTRQTEARRTHRRRIVK